MGVMMAMFFFNYALGLWYGSVLIEGKRHNDIYDRPYSAGDVLVIFFAIMIGGFSMG